VARQLTLRRCDSWGGDAPPHVASARHAWLRGIAARGPARAFLFRMKIAPLLFLVLPCLAASGCASGSSGDPPSDETGEGELRQRAQLVCFAEGAECTKVPKLDDPNKTYVDDKCFYWNRKSSDRASKRYKVLRRSRSKQQDAVTLDQLRATLRYFQRESEMEGLIEGTEGKKLEDLTVDQLFELAEDPIFYTLEDRQTGDKFTRINFAAGENPMDAVFKDRTLIPVALAEDDSLFFCSRDRLGK
jgi:hypothetical protein